MMSMASGLILVCMKAFPMPSSENATSMKPKLWPMSGMMSDTTVMMRERSTVFFRPILFMSMPVGTEKMRNQKKTSDGKMLATESLRLRSSLT